jgi:small-conductance mechanosensitive channel
MNTTTILDYIDKIFHYHLFQINQTWVTPSSIIMFIVLIALFFLASRLLQKLFIVHLLNRFNLDKSTQYNLTRVIHYIIMITGAVVAFQFIGINLSGLAVIFGLLSVGIGFGLQNIVSNFISGLILLFERPVKIGDRVTVGDTQGDVLSINMRSTTIRSLNNISIIVPNSDLITTQVINWSHGDPKVRLDVDIGVSYESDLDSVLKTLQEIASENQDVLKKPEPEVIFMNFGDSSWNFQLRVWLKDPYDYYRIRSDINCSIVRKFRKNKIEIPFPQRDLHIRSPIPVPLEKQSN